MNMVWMVGIILGGALLIPIGLMSNFAEYLPTPDFLTYRYLRWKLRRMKKLQADVEDVERKWDIRRLEAALYRELN